MAKKIINDESLPDTYWKELYEKSDTIIENMKDEIDQLKSENESFKDVIENDEAFTHSTALIHQEQVAKLELKIENLKKNTIPMHDAEIEGEKSTKEWLEKVNGGEKFKYPVGEPLKPKTDVIEDWSKLHETNDDDPTEELVNVMKHCIHSVGSLNEATDKVSNYVYDNLDEDEKIKLWEDNIEETEKMIRRSNLILQLLMGAMLLSLLGILFTQ